MGAEVTGLDALEKNVKTAQVHADESGLDIDYRYGAIEAMVAAGETPFDVVLNMEVLEHVTNPSAFVKDCGQMVRPGGLMFCSTLNRTAKAFTMAIFGAEYIMRWLPKGTHQYRKFITPAEFVRMLKDAGWFPTNRKAWCSTRWARPGRLAHDTGVKFGEGGAGLIPQNHPITPLIPAQAGTSCCLHSPD